MHGSEVYEQINAEVGKVESQSQNLAAQLNGCETQITRLTDEREDCLVRLAEIYLPDLAAQSVQRTLREFQRDVKQIFAEKKRRRQELEQLMQTSQQKTATFQKQLETLTLNLNQKAAERDSTLKEIATELHANQDYATLDKQAQDANSRLDQYKKRVDAVKSEAAQKLPAFESSKLFMYLVRRNFDSNNPGTGITAKLDSWVAGVINFAEAKKNYDFLKSMPELMGLEVKARQEALDKIVLEMQRYEAQAGERHRLPTIIEEGKRLAEQRRDMQVQIQTQDTNHDKYAQERGEIDGKKDPYHVEAIQRLKGFLKGEDIQELKTRARATPGSEDDKLVGRMEEIDSSVRQLKDRAKDVKARREEMGEKLSGLKRIQRHFTENDYESSRSRFSDDFNLNPLLVGYLAGRYSADHVNSQVSSSQHFKPEETYSSSSSYGGSSYHSSGGGFGGGGFSSGGGFGGGGGGFSSGKGF